MAKNNAAAAAEEETQGVGFEQGEGFTFDMSSQEESAGFEPMPKGVYNVVIDEAEFRISATSGNPMWALTLSVEDGEFENRKLFSYIVFSQKNLGRVKQFLNRVAPELSNERNLDPKQVAENGVLIGKRARARVAISKPTAEYPDPRNEVKDLLAAGSGGSGGFSM